MNFVNFRNDPDHPVTDLTAIFPDHPPVEVSESKTKFNEATGSSAKKK